MSEHFFTIESLFAICLSYSKAFAHLFNTDRFHLTNVGE